MPNSSSRTRTYLLLIAGLIILAMIPLALKQATLNDEQNERSSKKKRTVQKNISSRESATHLSKRHTPEDPPPSHKQEELKDFYIPPFDLKNVTLEEAIDSLLTRYRAICTETGESPIPFRYKIEGTPETIVFARPQGNFLSSLKHLAAMSGTTSMIEDTELLFTEIEDGPITTRRWTLTPRFISQINDLYLKTNPFEGTDIRAEEENIIRSPTSMTNKLKRLGIIQKNEANGGGLAGTFITRAGTKTQTRIDALISSIADNIPLSRINLFFGTDQEINCNFQSGKTIPIQQDFATDTEVPDYHFLVTASENGFGRTIQIVSFAGFHPTKESLLLFSDSGDVSDLGVRKNLSHKTFTITKNQIDEPQIFNFYNADGTPHQMQITSNRITPTGTSQ